MSLNRKAYYSQSFRILPSRDVHDKASGHTGSNETAGLAKPAV